MMFYYHIPFTPGLLLWPLFMIPLVLLVLGLGMILASLNVKYRDIKYAIPFFVQSILFVTPIIYPSSLVPERVKWLLFLNPLSGLIEAFRATVLPTREVAWLPIGISFGVTLIILAFAMVFFRKTEREFADII
jgi:lipopolysaccharide transport system permease protein